MVPLPFERFSLQTSAILAHSSMRDAKLAPEIGRYPSKIEAVHWGGFS